MSSRLEAMDSQRYDISKSRSRSTFSLRTQATSGHSDALQQLISFLDFGPIPFNSPTLSVGEDDPAQSDGEYLSHSNVTTPVSGGSTESLTLEDTPENTESTFKLEESDEDNYTTTHTIISPLPLSPITSFFSRPSSPVSRPSSPKIFRTLNCFGSTDAFEDDIDYLQPQRAKELGSKEELRILVTRTVEIRIEESWRNAVQEVLYGNCSAEAAQFGPVVTRGA